jgi:prephenate dehydrogenase
MAGKEARGVAAATPDLFAGRPWIFTPRSGEPLSHPSVGDFVSQVSRCGAVPVFLQPDKHDCTVAFTSHLPQLASTALACSIGSQLIDPKDLAVSGQGLRDQTRLALSAWDVWQDIIETNTVNIQHALNVFIDTLTDLRDNLQTQRTGEHFRFAADVAGKVRRCSPDSRDEG